MKYCAIRNGIDIHPIVCDISAPVANNTRILCVMNIIFVLDVLEIVRRRIHGDYFLVRQRDVYCENAHGETDYENRQIDVL